MKTFLFPTDFSANAKHALNYGYSLAKQVKANMIICNTIIEPAEIPQAGLVSWPMEESDLLQDDSNRELKLLKEQMENKEETDVVPKIISIKPKLLIRSSTQRKTV